MENGEWRFCGIAAEYIKNDTYIQQGQELFFSIQVKSEHIQVIGIYNQVINEQIQINNEHIEVIDITIEVKNEHIEVICISIEAF